MRKRRKKFFALNGIMKRKKVRRNLKKLKTLCQKNLKKTKIKTKKVYLTN